MVSRLVWLRILCVALLAAPLVQLASSHPALAADKADDDDDKGDDKGDDKAAANEEQPPVTAGGLYTRDSYPVNEVGRPLNLTQKMIEARLDFEFNLAEGSIFDPIVVGLAARYGFTDTLEFDLGVLATLKSDSYKAVSVAAQQSIIYDLLAARLALVIPFNPDTAFDIVVGMPVKYRLSTDKIAIVALENIVTFHTKGGAKPDLNVSVGGIFQVLDNLAVIGRATLTLVGFSASSKADVIVPIEIDAQYSVNTMIDVGLEVFLGNINQDSGVLDNRAAGLFLRAHY